MNINLTGKDRIEIQNLIYAEIKNIDSLIKFNKSKANKYILTARKIYYLGLLNRT